MVKFILQRALKKKFPLSIFTSKISVDLHINPVKGPILQMKRLRPREKCVSD